MHTEDVIIVGAGPAGLTTALQLRRYGVKCRIFEGERIGGLLWNANLVENYPGFPGGVSGPQLVDLFIQQVRGLGIQVNMKQVVELGHNGEVFQMETNADHYQAQIVVIATGTEPRRFPGDMVPDSVREQVFYEVYPLLSTKDQHIAIVGAGDAAFDYGLNLAKANHVTILNRTRQLKCLPLLWERAQSQPRITYCEDTQVINVRQALDGRLDLVCAHPTGEIRLQVDYLVGAIGRDPRLDFLSPGLKERTGILENENRLYFVGDVSNGIYRQTAIAVGDGLLAAMKIYQYLEEKEQ